MHQFMQTLKSLKKPMQGVPKKRGQNDMADQSYNKDQKSHRNMGQQTFVEGARTTRGPREGQAKEQKEIEFIRAVDA